MRNVHARHFRLPPGAVTLSAMSSPASNDRSDARRGSSAVAVIEGDAGIGKTALLGVLRRRS